MPEYSFPIYSAPIDEAVIHTAPMYSTPDVIPQKCEVEITEMNFWGLFVEGSGMPIA